MQGRPIDLTEDLIAELAELRGNGLSLRDTARAAGMGERSLKTFLHRGRQDHEDGVPETAHGRLVSAMEEAESRRQAALLGIVRRDASEPRIIVRETTKADGAKIVTRETRPPDAGSAKWLLERLNPERFSPVMRSEIGRPGEITGAMTVGEALERLEAILGPDGAAPALEAPDEGAHDD